MSVKKVCIITGSARGIGAACVHKLAEAGYDVAYTYVSSAPNLPAVAELIPGFDFAPTIGFFAPPGTPRELIARSSADANDAARSADVTAKLAGLDIQTVGSTPEEYAAALKSDEGRYAKAVKISGATAD